MTIHSKKFLKKHIFIYFVSYNNCTRRNKYINITILLSIDVLNIQEVVRFFTEISSFYEVLNFLIFCYFFHRGSSLGYHIYVAIEMITDLLLK